MASPTAMAKCLRADAKLLLAGHDAHRLKSVGEVAEGVFYQSKQDCDDCAFSTDEFRAVLMLAAAAALEADDEGR